MLEKVGKGGEKVVKRGEKWNKVEKWGKVGKNWEKCEKVGKVRKVGKSD